MKKIESEIIINAPPGHVWDILMDFEQYHRWNSFTPRITLRNSDVRVGAEFDLDCQMTETQLLKDEHEEILTLEPERHRFAMGTSRTRGRPGIRSFRWQICIPGENNTTFFRNYEEFDGPLALLVYFLYRKKLESAFDRFCRDLKKRAEE